MAKKKRTKHGMTKLTEGVPKQAIGGLTGAAVGAAIAGPIGAVVGGVAGAFLSDSSAMKRKGAASPARKQMGRKTKTSTRGSSQAARGKRPSNTTKVAAKSPVRGSRKTAARDSASGGSLRKKRAKK